VETANAEKTALLEQKEIVVQQLLGEKQLLQVDKIKKLLRILLVMYQC